MIGISLGAEPKALAPVRSAELAALVALGRAPKSDEIKGYRVIAEELWRLQHQKCCYCEAKIRFKFNDVEHYRPKGFADRAPGATETHGYWWLAYTWKNLLYACSTCNRSNKNSRFPLARGSVALTYDSAAPGGEVALLLNPAEGDNPVEHIKFVFERGASADAKEHWWARPRNGSVKGSITIDVCGLNDQDLLELRDCYFSDFVSEKIDDLKQALATQNVHLARSAFQKALHMLKPTVPHVALAYDAMSQNVPDELIFRLIGERWPSPTLVGR